MKRIFYSTSSTLLLLFTLSIGTSSCEKTVKETKDKTVTTLSHELNPEIEGKITDLLSKMPLKSKVGQMCQVTLDVMMKRDSANQVLEPNVLDPAKLKHVLEDHEVGSILNVGYHTFDRKKWYDIMDTIQGIATQKTPNKIPVIYGIDAIHGVTYTVDGTLFPQEIGLAATWNKECAKNLGTVTAYETRASGISWNFSPVLDLGRQPLWSRFFETLGEDVHLAQEMGTSIVEGYQGQNTANKNKVVACLKHYVGYSNPLSGRDRTPSWIPKRMMEEFYLPPFKSAIDAGALTVMVNSGDVNGIPGHANYHLLTEVLKEKWGFIGFAVSDWEDFIMLQTVSEVSPSYKDAIKTAVNAGVDMSMVPYSPYFEEYCRLLIELVEEKEVSMERIDDAVRRILRVKFMNGLFETTHFPADDYKDFGSEKHRKMAYDAAAESITLLKNTNSVLPLNKSSKVLVTGPAAHSLTILNGAWTHTWQGVDTSFNTKGKKTILDAVKAKIGAKNVLYAEGSVMKMEDNWEINESKNLNDVRKKARLADAVIVCLGELPSTERPGDITSLNLPDEQKEIVKTAAKSGKPIVIVLVEGRPKIINDIEPMASAVIQAYLPGNEGGLALADILFGDVNPSGKLPYVYPRYDGVIEHYDHKYSEDKSGKTNDFNHYNPQWNFGHGLSYTTFSYSNLETNLKTFGKNDTLKVTVTVKNQGQQTGKEVVQLYSRDHYASVSPSRKKLKGFKKVSLEAGESKKVSFSLPANRLSFVGIDNDWVLETGKFSLMIEELEEEIELIDRKNP